VARAWRPTEARRRTTIDQRESSNKPDDKDIGTYIPEVLLGRLKDRRIVCIDLEA
jgi:hypothetical protein